MKHILDIILTAENPLFSQASMSASAGRKAPSVTHARVQVLVERRTEAVQEGYAGAAAAAVAGRPKRSRAGPGGPPAPFREKCTGAYVLGHAPGVPMVATLAAFPARLSPRPQAGPAASRRYEGRRPEKTPLYKIVSEFLENWLESTVGNMTKNSLGSLGPKEKIAAEGMYENMTVALESHPTLARRLGCESVEALADRQMEEMLKKLTPLQRRRFQRRMAEGGGEGKAQGVA